MAQGAIILILGMEATGVVLLLYLITLWDPEYDFKNITSANKKFTYSQFPI